MKTFKIISLTSLLIVGAFFVYETARAEHRPVQNYMITAPTPEEKVWLDFGPAVVELEGKLVLKTYYGPPNYGEDPANDSKEKLAFLELAKPVNVRGKGDDSFESDPVENIRTVQLALSEPHKDMIGKTVRVKGTLFGAHTGHHHTDVLMDVQEILAVESISDGIRLIDTQNINKSGYGSALVSNYEVEGEDLSLTEIRLQTNEMAEKALDSRVKSLDECSFSHGLKYDHKQVGRLFTCEEKKRIFFVYSYGEKFYEISSVSENAVVLFTKEVLPMACQLRNSTECISMYY